MKKLILGMGMTRRSISRGRSGMEWRGKERKEGTKLRYEGLNFECARAHRGRASCILPLVVVVVVSLNCDQTLGNAKLFVRSR